MQYTSIMQASLPMYDFPELREATDAWWKGVTKHMRLRGIADTPDALTRNRSLDSLWRNEKLLFSQCCGFDVMNSYKDHLSVLMVSNWDVEQCSTGQYCSFVVVHEGNDAKDLSELKGSVAVINGKESHSGMNALFSTVQPFSEEGKFFKAIHISGAHADSLRYVQTGQADVAAIDAVTFTLLQQYRPTAVEGLRVLCQTKPAPALPYVTSIHTPLAKQQAMQTALAAAFNDPDLALVRKRLLLKAGVFPELCHEQNSDRDANNPYQEIAEGFTFDPRLLDAIVVT